MCNFENHKINVIFCHRKLLEGMTSKLVCIPVVVVQSAWFDRNKDDVL